MSAKEDIAKIYVGYFGRSPEPEGFNYWLEQANEGFTALQTAASFSVQPEATAKYPYLANPLVAKPEPFVISVYQNLFNRDPDPEGLEYWVNELNAANGKPDAVGSMILNIISGAQDTEAGQDLTTIQNKMSVALDWVESTSEIAGFEYDTEAAASAKSVVAEVDETEASVEAGMAETDAFVAKGPSGQSFSLTTNVDSAQNFTGTDGADTFFATGDTLNTGDQLVGGGGIDKLSVQAGQFQSIVATPRMEGIEEIEILGGANNLFAQFDFTTSNGVEMGTLEGVSGTVQFIGVGYPFDLKVANSSTPTPTAPTSATTSLNVQYKSQAVAGDEDIQKLELVNSGLASLSIEGIEHVEVTATGLNYVSSFNQSKSLTVEGSGNLWTSFSSPDREATFDSTGSTGDMNISFAKGQDVTAKAGSGDDKLNFTSTSTVDVDAGNGDDYLIFGSRSVRDTDTIDGGEGKDTLVTNSTKTANAEIVNTLDGLEALQFQSTVSELVASDYTVIDEFVFNGQRSSGTMEVSGVQSDDRFIFTADHSQFDNLLSFTGENVGEELYMELRAFEDGTFKPTGERVKNGEVTLYAYRGSESGSDDDDFVSAVVLEDNISAVTINSTGSNTDANVIIGHQDTTAHPKHVAFDNEDGPASFTIVGDHALNLGHWDVISNLKKDSQQWGFSDAVNVDASDFEAVLQIALSADDDVFEGGIDTDIIYGLDGDDRLTGNDGADQFRFVGKEGTDTIVDFLVEEDAIGFNLFDFRDTRATSEGTVLSEEDYVENRDGITEIGTADNFKVIELQDALSAEQIATDEGANIMAYILAFNTTSEKAELWYDADWSTSDSRSMVASFDNIVDLAGVQEFTNDNFLEFI